MKNWKNSKNFEIVSIWYLMIFLNIFQSPTSQKKSNSFVNQFIYTKSYSIEIMYYILKYVRFLYENQCKYISLYYMCTLYNHCAHNVCAFMRILRYA